MRALVAASVLLLAGCSVSAGPQIVHSSDLGLDSPYGAVYASLSHDRVEGEVRVSDAQKSGSESGVGVSGRVLAKAGGDKWTIGAGGYFTYQTHDNWTKTTAGPAIMARRSWRSGSGELALTGPDGDKVDGSVILRVVGNKRLAPLVEYEHVLHTEGSGRRVAVGLLWRLR